MALRLLHFADLHLDRSFASQRLYGTGAQRRREDLRAALLRIVERARDARADLITCAGDLFEHDHITRESAAFLAETLGAAGRPVLIAPGNKDPAVPSSPYRYLRWPDNVIIAAHQDLRAYRYGGVSIWSAGFTAPEVSESPIRDVREQSSDIHLLLLHGSDMTSLPPGKRPHMPLVPSQLEQAGFSHALLGHYHEARSNRLVTYPGSPEPLGWEEAGRHTVALVTVSERGIGVELEDINRRRFIQETIDVSQMTSSAQLREALLTLQGSERPDGAVVRATLTGMRSRGLQLDPDALALEWSDRFAYLELQDQSELQHDLDAVAAEFTSRGELVRQLAIETRGVDPGTTAKRALQLALDAFEE